MSTVKQFLLKKFPTNEYMDCPVPKQYWEVMQEYAEWFALQNKVSDIVDTLHPDSKKLLKVCFEEIRLKLIKNQQKYGWSNEWLTRGWEDECREQMMEHIKKGDPRDLAIYAMFMMYRGWSTVNPKNKPDPTTVNERKDSTQVFCAICGKSITETGTVYKGKPVHIECYHKAKQNEQPIKSEPVLENKVSDSQVDFLPVLEENYQAQIAGYYNFDKTDEEKKIRNAVIEEYKDLIAIYKSKLKQKLSDISVNERKDSTQLHQDF